MSKRVSYHITHSKNDNNWHVQKAGGQRSSANFSTQADAINAARSLAQNANLGQIVVHRKDNNHIRIHVRKRPVSSCRLIMIEGDTICLMVRSSGSKVSFSR